VRMFPSYALVCMNLCRSFFENLAEVLGLCACVIKERHMYSCIVLSLCVRVLANVSLSYARIFVNVVVCVLVYLLRIFCVLSSDSSTLKPFSR
jgi:hypothetical protein